jgi:hypothetical protein
VLAPVFLEFACISDDGDLVEKLTEPAGSRAH